MKKLLLLFLALSFIQLAQAQNNRFKFGLRAGLTTSDLKASSLLVTNPGEFQDLKLDIADANYGIQFGLFAQARIGKIWFVQPEVVFNSSSVDYQVSAFKGAQLVPEVLRETYNHVDIPLMTGLKLGPLRLQAGPVGHVFVSSKSELLDVEGYAQDFKKMTLGYQAGVGLDLWNIIIDIKHEGNFNNLGDHMNFFGQDYAFDTRPGRTVFSVGFSF